MKALPGKEQAQSNAGLLSQSFFAHRRIAAEDKSLTAPAALLAANTLTHKTGPVWAGAVMAPEAWSAGNSLLIGSDFSQFFFFF